MNKLKFSHDYKKLPLNWENTQAILIGVSYCSDIQRFFKRCPQLLKIDTAFRGEDGFYNICFKEAIILTFIHLNSGIIFTTIRRYTEQKTTYYISSLHETFELLRIKEGD